jgi:hypothetical protein
MLVIFECLELLYTNGYFSSNKECFEFPLEFGGAAYLTFVFDAHLAKIS